MSSIKSLILAALLLLPAAAAADGNARIALVNAARAPQALSVAFCRAQGEACETHRVERGTALEGVELPAGRYEVRVTAEGGELSRFRLGVADGDHYALMLYGLAKTPVQTGWWTAVKQALGGVDARQVNRFQLADLVLPLEAGKPDDKPRIRLVNLAPGAQPLMAKIHADTRAVSLAATKYGAASPKKRVGPGRVRVDVALSDARAALAELKLDLPGGSANLLIVAALDTGEQAQLIHLQSVPEGDR